MNLRSRRTTVRIVRAAVIAALYAGLSLALPWISFGPVQFRVSEALTVLPLLFPESIVGLTIGCAVANAVGSSWIDAAIGAPTTLIAAVLTWLTGRFVRRAPAKIAIGIAPPVLLNAVTVPFVFLLTGAGVAYWFGFATVLAGQLVCIVGLGVPLYFAAARVYKSFALGRRPGRASKSPIPPDPAAQEPADGKE